jgi:hypothetical protein
VKHVLHQVCMLCASFFCSHVCTLANRKCQRRPRRTTLLLKRHGCVFLEPSSLFI